jgi:hypothetical protein
MRKMLLLSTLLLVHVTSLACEVCKKQQPKALRGITHGAGPQSEWDYVVVLGTVFIAVVSLFYSIKWIIHPGERDTAHIKRSIFNLD